MDWLEQAKSLKEGQSCRVTHDCGHGRAAIICHNKEYYSFYCFRCAERHYVKKDFSLPEYLKKKKDEEEQIATERVKEASHYTMESLSYLDLTDSIGEFSHEALCWLFRAGITESMIHEYKIQYSRATKRVFLPVYNKVQDEDRLVFFQLRGFELFKPKYINPRKKPKVQFRTGPITDMPLVLTEDILSSIKVGQVTRTSALLGTDADTNLIANIMVDDKVIIWLDPDSPGQKKARKLIDTFRALGVTGIYNVVSQKDPKLYNKDEIKKILDDVYKGAEKGNK